MPPGQTVPRPGTVEAEPVFRGSLDPDIMFFGFGFTAAQARGVATDPGWFFVIQQQPAEPRFGLDVGVVPPPSVHLSPAGTSAATARALLQRPVRIAIHARDLLPASA